MADSVLGWFFMIVLIIVAMYYVAHKAIAEQEALHLEREREQDEWYM